ncbi:GNAT family N-acetyltransferase [Chloroflexus sp.]|uniref:GNAT family N-acetyltransferase n=1 Tax=Chloroflexus sp. TaxID=1904827 RepID=UPI00262CAB56|nr:GNAT family protein [uncultured Chloroflexus sp.]
MGSTLFTTERLWLRVMEPCDNEAVRGYFRRAWTFGEDWLPIPPADFFTLQGQRRRLAAEAEARRERHSLRLFLVRRDDPFERICGDIWFDCIDQVICRVALIEFRMEERSCGKGYMGEALPVAMALAGAELGIDRFEALIAPQHTAACRLVARCGFTPLSTIVCWRQLGQGWVEHQVYATVATQTTSTAHTQNR